MYGIFLHPHDSLLDNHHHLAITQTKSIRTKGYVIEIAGHLSKMNLPKSIRTKGYVKIPI